jgi:hypothetical protein
MKMPGCEFSKAIFLASPRDLPSDARVFLMAKLNWQKAQAVLEPVERISEFLFGFAMVLTLTCTFNVREANRSSVRTLLMDALGCIVDWGSSTLFSIS